MRPDLLTSVEFQDGPPESVGEWTTWYVGEEKLQGRVIEFVSDGVRVSCDDGTVRKVYL